MLDISSEKMFAEYNAAKTFRNKHLESLDQRIRRFHGPAYDGVTNDDYEPENHEYEYISLVLPQLFFDSPRVRVSTIRQGAMQDIALALQAGLNRWIRDVRLELLLNDVGTDMLLGWGMALLTMEPNPARGVPPVVREAAGMDDADIAWRPTVERVSPRRCFWDPAALTYREARYVGHEWVRDKNDLIVQAEANPQEGWRLDAIRGLTQHLGDIRKADDERSIPERGEVVGVTMYLRGHQIEGQPGSSEGFNGCLLEFALSGNGFVMIREPRMFYGPAQGPYYLFGVYTVSDKPIPLSPTTAMAMQVDTMNLHARAVSKAAGARKRVVFTNDKDPQLSNAVKQANDGEVVQVNTDDLNNNLKEVELGGVTEAALQGLTIERERRDRISGMSDAMRGNVSGNATATENSIAKESGAFRIGYLQRRAAISTTELLRGVAWYMYYDDRVVFPLEDDAAVMPNQSISPEAGPWYYGGDPATGSGFSFEDLDLEIEPYSMERTSEALQQKRLMDVTSVLGQVLPLAMQSPVKIKDLFNLLGNLTNIPELSKVVDLDAAQAIQQITLQGMLMPQAPVEQGRLGKDVGMSPPGGSMPAPSGPPMGGGLDKPM